MKILADEKKRAKLFFFLILLLGIAVRIFRFGQIPCGINQDEAMAAMDAKALLSYGTDRLGMKLPVHFTAWGWAQMSVLLSYLMVPCIALFGFTTVAVRLPMLLISIAGMVFFYLLVKEILGEKTALLLFFLTAINPWHILQSRWSLDCNLFPHLFVIGAYLLLTGIKKRSRLFLSMVFFGLCLYCYGVSVYSVPLFLFVLALYLWRTGQVPLYQIFLAGVLFGLVALPELLTMFLNLVGLPSIETPLFTIPYFSGTVRSKDILLTSFSIRQLFINLFYTLKAALLQTPDLFHNTIPAFGTMYHFSILFLPFGIYRLFTSFKKETDASADLTVRTSLLLLAAWFFMGVWVGLITKEVNVNRINIIHYPCILLTALGILTAAERFPKLYRPVLTVFGLLFLLFIGTYFTSYAAQSREEYHEDYLEAMRAADSLPIDYLYISTDEHPQTMEILLQYALQTDALYYQQKTCLNNGKEYLPYSERYRFCYLAGDTLDWEQPRTAYLVTEQEWQHLNDTLYTIYDYGRYRLYVYKGASTVRSAPTVPPTVCQPPAGKLQSNIHSPV